MDFEQRFFLGPMSKQIVDCVLKKNFKHFAFIPSRRQVDVDYGYVNNWKTNSFSNYIKFHDKNFIICRDHSGPNQGHKYDDGLESLKNDCIYFDIIHIDPFKNSSDFEQAKIETLNLIKYCLNLNENIFFEVGTEEAIFKYDENELYEFLKFLQVHLDSKFEKIKFAVIQSGTRLLKTKQDGIFDESRLVKMIDVCRHFNIKSKEHNGDYLPKQVIKDKFKLGLDAINIAPEIGVCQTEAILENLNTKEIELYWKMCLDSNFWKKWVDDKFDPYEDRIELIKICGHYMFSNDKFKMNINISKYENEISKAINSKLEEMVEILNL